MTIRTFCVALVSLTAASVLAAAAPLPDNAQSRAHIEAARRLAGNDSWLQAPFNFYCVAGNARANNGQAPVREPVKTRGAGDPHPFQVATDRYVTFWSIISECIQAEIARRPA
jgi:hypothetical protein